VEVIAFKRPFLPKDRKNLCERKDIFMVQRLKRAEYKLARKITEFAGSMPFVYFHVVWFFLWIVLGTEPFPFGLLTMIVSLEAIFLSTFIMISQNLEMEFTEQQAEEEDQEVEYTKVEIQDIQRDLEEIKNLIRKKKN